jgi:hypothetical protein
LPIASPIFAIAFTSCSSFNSLSSCGYRTTRVCPAGLK